MVLNKGPIPLYYQLEIRLRKRILSGTYSPSQAFPTEKELCDEFAVSRATVRQALMALEGDGLIERHRGRGTFVAHVDQGYRHWKLYGELVDLWLSGEQTVLKLHSKELIDPDHDMIRDMNLEQGDRLYLFEGIRRTDAGDKAFFQAFIPQDIGENISLEEELSSPFFIQRVEKEALEAVRRARQILSAAAATAKIASVLGTEPGHPLLVVKRIYFSKTDRVLETAVTQTLAETYQIESELIRAAPESNARTIG